MGHNQIRCDGGSRQNFWELRRFRRRLAIVQPVKSVELIMAYAEPIRSRGQLQNTRFAD